jgi:hypothetical protein
MDHVLNPATTVLYSVNGTAKQQSCKYMSRDEGM